MDLKSPLEAAPIYSKRLSKHGHEKCLLRSKLTSRLSLRGARGPPQDTAALGLLWEDIPLRVSRDRDGLALSAQPHAWLRYDNNIPAPAAISNRKHTLLPHRAVS